MSTTNKKCIYKCRQSTAVALFFTYFQRDCCSSQLNLRYIWIRLMHLQWFFLCAYAFDVSNSIHENSVAKYVGKYYFLMAKFISKPVCVSFCFHVLWKRNILLFVLRYILNVNTCVFKYSIVFSQYMRYISIEPFIA